MGIIGFGGPAAHIALMRREFVEQRGWYDNDEFLRMVGFTNLIPGPNSTELAMHIGHRRAGTRGLFVSGLAFIVPAVVLVGLLSWLYTEFGTRPGLADLRYGTGPVVVAIVAHAAVAFLRSTVTSPSRSALVLASFAAAFAGVDELIVLLVAGLLTAIATLIDDSPYGRRRRDLSIVIPFGALATAGTADLARLFGIFLKIGAVLYGSGYLLFSFIESDFVTRRGWLTEEQLIDAITVGQVTPGPLFSSATFVGWILLGIAGAAAATIGIFGPSFLFVGFMGRVLPWIERHRLARHFISGVTVASVGMILAAALDLGDASLVDPLTVAVGAVTFVLLLRTRINSLWLVLAGVAVGLARMTML